MIVQAYGEFKNKEYYLGDKTVESKIFENESFGFTRVTIERPKRDEKGILFIKKW